MKWTTDVPTEEGYYWADFGDGDFCVVNVLEGVWARKGFHYFESFGAAKMDYGRVSAVKRWCRCVPPE